jgi:hypothetical protein
MTTYKGKSYNNSADIAFLLSKSKLFLLVSKKRYIIQKYIKVPTNHIKRSKPKFAFIVLYMMVSIFLV